MTGRYCYKEVLPFTAMVAIECTNVGVNVLFKAATEKGLSYYAFVAYSFLISTLLLLLPLPFVFRWSRGLPQLNLPLIFRIFLLGVIGLAAQLCGYKGLNYTSPTLASALSNLIPAFTFVLAIIFRVEKVALRSSSTQAKILGSSISILGALIVLLYKGPMIFSTSSPQLSPAVDSPMSSTSQTNWVLGGSLLAIEFLLVPIWYIVQTNIMKQYPAEFIVVFLYNLSGTLISAPICLLLEENLSAWKINPDITLMAVIYSGFFCTGLSSLVHTWGIHLKGPVYVSIFKPLSIVVAAVLSVVFLGDALYFGTYGVRFLFSLLDFNSAKLESIETIREHEYLIHFCNALFDIYISCFKLCSVVGAVILSFGFYAVIWGNAKEGELSEDFDMRPPSSSKSPLLVSYKGKDNEEITHC